MSASCPCGAGVTATLGFCIGAGTLAQVLMFIQQVFLLSEHLPSPSSSEQFHLPPASIYHVWGGIALAAPLPSNPQKWEKR